MKNVLQINNLCVTTNEQPILKNIQLTIEPGSVHALMGPNGSGKSTLAMSLMGHPRYCIESGSIVLGDKEITAASPDQRAKTGLFLAMQYPVELPGVQLFTFLKEAKRAVTGKDCAIDEFYDELCKTFELLGIDESWAYRNLEGFSGGEKKRFELLQLLILKPKIAVLDEIDSGLDVDALKIVARGLQFAREQNPSLSLLIITHYQRILNYISPDCVHLMHNGSIIQSGDVSLAQIIDQQGYHELQSI